MEGSKPLTEAEAHRAFILARGILEVHPRSGRLPPGGAAAVSLRARPAAEGEWRLPVFLRVADGRQLHLSLGVSHAAGLAGSRAAAHGSGVWQLLHTVQPECPRM